MSLIIPEDYEQLRRQRDRQLKALEKEMEEGADELMRTFLARIQKELRPFLTASIVPQDLSRLIYHGELQGWWDEGVDQLANSRVWSTYLTGRYDITDATPSRGSLDALGTYLTNVKDRLSRTAQPTIPDQAFDTIRFAISDELVRGSSTQDMARRIASDLSWTGPDRGLWEDRLSQADGQIDQILDAIGPPGDPSREAMRLNDPEIRALQEQRSAAIRELDRDQSVWETRAERIARTETTAAYNAGAQQAFFEEGAGAKMWIATADERTRETHLEISGKCVPTDGTFSVGGAELVMPGDPSGPPEETINCRCTMIAGPSCDELRGIAAQAEEVMDEEREKRGMELSEDREPEPVALEPEPDEEAWVETNPLDQTEDVEIVPGERDFAEPTHRQISNFSEEELLRIEDRTNEKKELLEQRLGGIDERDLANRDLARADHVIEYGNEHLGSIYEAQGFDALPTLVDDINAVPGGEVIYRGISNVRSGSGVIEGSALAESFKSGSRHWPGLGAIGSGSYSSTLLKTAQQYAQGGGAGTSATSVQGQGGGVMAMKLKPGSRVITQQAAKKAMDEELLTLQLEARKAATRADPGARVAQLRADSVGSSPFAYGSGVSDVGEWAALNGYDAMVYRMGGAANAENYYIVLNRGAVYVER